MIKQKIIELSTIEKTKLFMPAKEKIRYGTLLIDGWKTASGIHVVAIVLKLKEKFHVVGVETTNESQDAVWLAS